MPSAVLQHLHERIRAAAAVVSAQKKEREKLEAEVVLMREESRRSRQVLREHRELLAERERLKGRLERLYKKLDDLKV
jgi:predicted RNase H-like nuclease (RuvC/YqgF family)